MKKENEQNKPQVSAKDQALAVRTGVRAGGLCADLGGWRDVNRNCHVDQWAMYNACAQPMPR
jgi:hypothetical protein